MPMFCAGAGRQAAVSHWPHDRPAELGHSRRKVDRQRELSGISESLKFNHIAIGDHPTIFYQGSRESDVKPSSPDRGGLRAADCRFNYARVKDSSVDLTAAAQGRGRYLFVSRQSPRPRLKVLAYGMNSIDLTELQNVTSHIQRQLNYFRANGQRRVQYLSLARCDLNRVPQVFDMRDNHGRPLSQTVSYMSLYGNRFEDVSMPGRHYEVDMNATRASELMFFAFPSLNTQMSENPGWTTPPPSPHSRFHQNALPTFTHFTIIYLIPNQKVYEAQVILGLRTSLPWATVIIYFLVARMLVCFSRLL
ncbi:hypothetical protein EVAR_45786_1 [Eumeta japonica]|uniref:Uncharacterized protein n=1 Tax=Eumeta variegata TaxID=151549 RepID=A0A4C1X034_EUMVA|nr:hypothetical protein EVAR_45786_1 [Eumeta japonica]